MNRKYHKLSRLYIDAIITSEQLISLDADQWHYVRNVMRMVDGDNIMIFNGVDGEWLATLVFETKKRICLKPVEQTKLQTPKSKLVYAFAPLKKGRIDYMIQKATELGAGILQCVITDHTINNSQTFHALCQCATVIWACSLCSAYR